jgi:hypothetical protein
MAKVSLAERDAAIARYFAGFDGGEDFIEE